MKKITSKTTTWLACGLATTFCLTAANAQDAPDKPARPGPSDAPRPSHDVERERPARPRPNAPRDGDKEDNMFKMADDNRDGKVTFDELKASSDERLRRMFDMTDANKDGEISQDEARKAHKLMEAHRDKQRPDADDDDDEAGDDDDEDIKDDDHEGDKNRPRANKSERFGKRPEGLRGAEIARRLQEKMRQRNMEQGKELRDTMQEMKQRIEELKKEMEERLNQQEEELRKDFLEGNDKKERKRDKKDEEPKAE